MPDVSSTAPEQVRLWVPVGGSAIVVALPRDQLAALVAPCVARR
jgi:hypothetical protein